VTSEIPGHPKRGRLSLFSASEWFSCLFPYARADIHSASLLADTEIKINKKNEIFYLYSPWNQYSTKASDKWKKLQVGARGWGED